jgi:3-dehydroquinate dehydratase-1
MARTHGVELVLSHHDFRATPSPSRLETLQRSAQAAGADIFKVAALTSTPRDLSSLLSLLSNRSKLPLSVMGMGALGKVSRLVFAEAGSVLNYGYLDRPNASGQWEATLLKQRLKELREE